MNYNTEVAIIGAGPAGLLLGRLLTLAGIENIVIETRSQEYVKQRQRAGLLEQPTVDLLCEIGIDSRLKELGFFHEGFEFRFDGQKHRVALRENAAGASTVLYPQTEIVKDLLTAREISGEQILFDVEDVRLKNVCSDRPSLLFRDKNGLSCEVRSVFIAGCDGYHGVSRQYIPEDDKKSYSRSFPFQWLKVMAEAPPVTTEIIYASHPDGFAMQSLRSEQLSQLYMQVPLDTSLEEWNENRIWDTLQERMAARGAPQLNEGKIVKQDLVKLRTFGIHRLQYGRLFLAGDSAHIVPPSAAKGLNQAAADAKLLSLCFRSYFSSGSFAQLDRYSEYALQRITQVLRFSDYMTELFHSFPDLSRLRCQQVAGLKRLVYSAEDLVWFCRNYTGLPFASHEAFMS
ncbi:4-hydroxybenzoate 3-monooxygenase [Pseudovibrio denitrificans]|uniref:4-hydroxybenzoate 3-monooxygenase n=1 Tax=Pseudovibrio denitrificans TaxID=258256 RepID=UPI0039BF07D4